MRKTISQTAGAILTVLLTGILSVTAFAGTGPSELVPLGGTVGISLSAEGVMVVGIPETMKDESSESPANAAGIKVGDMITKIGDCDISSKNDLKKAISELTGEAVTIEAVRGSETLTFSVTPYPTTDKSYELGLWLRDSIAGIGTMTFYDPQTGLFGALGHSISDAEAGVQLPLRKGVIARSRVTEVAQGKAGSPGQLQGSFDFKDILGNVTLNTNCGIFGMLENTDITGERESIPIASESEIHTGAATILSNVSGSDVKEYKIEISRVYTGSEADGRSMMITITDPRLIEKTGGIVQGMSGSPILQDGKLVGAVTHVLINDPERGYGVSVVKMLQTALGDSVQKAA